MKTETTEAIRTGLNEEKLELVSGGTEDGKIGPRDPRVKEALGFIKDAQQFAPKMMFNRAALIDILNSIEDSLKGIPKFSISKALTLLTHAWTTVKVMPTPPLPNFDEAERRRIILKDIDKARNILDPLV